MCSRSRCNASIGAQSETPPRFNSVAVYGALDPGPALEDALVPGALRSDGTSPIFGWKLVNLPSVPCSVADP